LSWCFSCVIDVVCCVVVFILLLLGTAITVLMFFLWSCWLLCSFDLFF
jgi:hypothetical protein